MSDYSKTFSKLARKTHLMWIEMIYSVLKAANIDGGSVVKAYKNFDKRYQKLVESTNQIAFHQGEAAWSTFANAAANAQALISKTQQRYASALTANYNLDANINQFVTQSEAQDAA